MAGIKRDDAFWMRRCFDLAQRGLGYVSPNPPVGAVLVYDGKLLAEGHHSHYGGPHAEVAAVAAVPADKRHLIKDSILYVSLEPCCIEGKTPACSDLILREKIKDVRISILDPNPHVSGKSIEILNNNGVQMTSGILADEGYDLIRSFSTHILRQRPHVILKWAQSAYGFMGSADEQIWFSGKESALWMHQQRARTDAILVGARTVKVDNPALTTRLHPGRSPHRVIYDPNNSLDFHSKVFDEDGRQVFYFSKSPPISSFNQNIKTFLLHNGKEHAWQIMDVLYKNRIGNLIVEGGAHTLQMFIDLHLWDEAWVIQTRHTLTAGIRAPIVRGKKKAVFELGDDRVIGMQATQIHH